MRDKEYPIWKISATWNNKSYKNNGTSFCVSFRRNFSQISMDRFTKKWWNRYIKKKYPNEIVELLKLECKYIGKDTWYMSWFSHKSLNRFDTEEKAFNSLREYFSTLTLGLDDNYITKNGHEYCTMALGDFWRWKYCKCKACKRRKETIVNH